jgi:hypothetical protein
VSLHAQVTLAECADPARRARLEADLPAWLKWYLANSYTRPFEDLHLATIKGTLEASSTGGRFCVAGERAIGKSTLIWGVILELKLSGLEPFPICVPWQESAKKRAFQFWKNAICFNDRIAADYPEYCAPFVHGKGVSQKIAASTWAHNLQPTGAQLAIGEGLIVFPDNRGCIGGSTINGNPRGLNHPQPDGSVIRPSIVLLDDVQDRKAAKSPIQVADIIEKIDGDVAGCGELGKDLAMVMACNCIEHEDVTAHYLADKAWNSVRVPCVLTWPKGWDADGGEVVELWEELGERIKNKTPYKTWYAANKKRMTDGMTLSAASAYATAKDCIDPFFGVIRTYCKMGRYAFMAEKQQAPEKQGVEVYALTAKTILSRVDNTRPAGEVPEWAKIVLVSSDVNPSYAISSVVLAFGADQRAAVLWYGTHAMACVDTWTYAQKKAYIIGELFKHAQELTKLPCRVTDWIIDGGGSPENTVIDFAATAQRLHGISTITAFGRAGKQYRTNEKKEYGVTIKEQAHVVRASALRRWIIWNQHYWLEQSHLAWTGTPSAPGSCELPKGNHQEFADQASREQIVGKVELNGRMIYDVKRSTLKHDFGDCMAQGYAFAAVLGIGTGGGGEVKESRRKKYTQAELRRA